MIVVFPGSVHNMMFADLLIPIASVRFGLLGKDLSTAACSEAL